MELRDLNKKSCLHSLFPGVCRRLHALSSHCTVTSCYSVTTNRARSTRLCFQKVARYAWYTQLSGTIWSQHTVTFTINNRIQTRTNVANMACNLQPIKLVELNVDRMHVLESHRRKQTHTGQQHEIPVLFREITDRRSKSVPPHETHEHVQKF